MARAGTLKVLTLKVGPRQLSERWRKQKRSGKVSLIFLNLGVNGFSAVVAVLPSLTANGESFELIVDPSLAVLLLLLSSQLER